MPRFNRIWAFTPAVIVMIVIFVLSSRSGEQLDSVLPWVQRWMPWLSDFNPMHYVAYFILALAVAYGLGKMSGSWQGCLWNIVICTLYGLTDEWHQSFVPMRSPDILDLLHDAIGAAAASILVYLAFVGYRHRNSINYTSS
jgi:hypothetical protein